MGVPHSSRTNISQYLNQRSHLTPILHLIDEKNAAEVLPSICKPTNEAVLDYNLILEKNAVEAFWSICKEATLDYTLSCTTTPM